MSEARRITGVGLARRAREFAEAAEHLVTKEGLSPVSFVFLFLIGHALELAYKSILANLGATEGSLKKIGHDLIKCREQTKAQFPGDLDTLEELGTDEILAMIGPYYKAKAFEYHTTGFYRLPGDPVQAATITSATVGKIASTRGHKYDYVSTDWRPLASGTILVQSGGRKCPDPVRMSSP